MTTVLKVTGLHAGYGRAEVLRGIGIEVDCASVCSVIGPNGAGKSTLLGALMGLLPARGEILFEGEDITGLSLEQRVLRGISLVPEKRELFGSMTVADNLLLGGWRPRSQGNGRWRDTLDQIYALFPRLHERQSQLAGTLSGGERQMLAIGRAMMSQPKLLMLDEPSLGLAPRIVGEILQTIDGLRASGVSVLLVEQNARAALAISQYGYVLETGDVALSGTASSLADDPRVIESYLGAAA
ncbi:ABC transporter ATP-binding protein [Variovorax sp. efr-133-TYG-130]|uniref:ABC transporter ATP-binding protein n=1 Tax=Variovorax sp. efr-133-TYG-130 TaxID=3040327 RepID=UPI002555C075|nr:ABC transporter ATP-binding protein [Variovorax sp. efr-133-TYG-130]